VGGFWSAELRMPVKLERGSETAGDKVRGRADTGPSVDVTRLMSRGA